MLFFQGQMPQHTYEHSLQLLLPQHQETQCYSLRVRVDTEKKDKRFVRWLSILFSCCTDLDFKTEKKFPVQLYVHIYTHAYFIPMLFTCIEEQSKTILPNTFSVLIRCFSFLPCFVSAFYQRSDSAPLHVHFRRINNGLAVGKGGQDCQCPVLRSNLQAGWEPWP